MEKQKDDKMDKKQLRELLRCRLMEFTDQQRRQKSKKVYQNLINTPEFQNAQVIMTYLSLPYEVDTAAIILQAWQQNYANT